MSPRRKGPRGPQKRWLVLAIFAVITIAAVVLVVSRNSSHPTDAAVAEDPASGAIPTTFASLGAASGAAKPTPQPNGAGILAGMQSSNGQFNQPGLVGNSWSHSQTPHTVVLHAWSSAPIPAMGWWVPTAHAGGKLFNKVSDWTHTFTAYGNPKYAQLYLVTDYRGIRVHCSVTVDGVVTASGQSNGPFGDVMCMG